MAVSWNDAGTRMSVIDLRKLDDDQIVIHYGGALTSVDAYTFANSLIALSDSIRALNSALNIGDNIEVRLEAVGPGSFRAKIKKIRKGLAGFFSRAPENVFWALFAFLLLPKLFEQQETETIVFEDRVEIRMGGDVVIIPREAYDKIQIVKNDENFQKGIRRTFEIIEEDDAISNFGITAKIEDTAPLIQIDRVDFARLSAPLTVTSQNTASRRERKDQARLTIIKPWLKAGNRKWTFEWNGVPLSAPILDSDFLSKIENRTYLIGYGDAIDVTLKFEQDYEQATDLWVNDPQSFRVIEVHNFIPKSQPRSLFDR